MHSRSSELTTTSMGIAASVEGLLLATGGGVPAPSAVDDDDSDDDDSTVRSRVDSSPSLKRNELQTYDSTSSSVAGPLAGGLAIPSAAPKNNDDPGTLVLRPAALYMRTTRKHVNTGTDN